MSSVTTTQQNKPQSLEMIISSGDFKTQVARALPSFLTADRFLRVAITSLKKSAKLRKCTVESFTFAMMRLSEMGLEANGYHAHLVPYGDEAKLIVDYKGLVELSLRSGMLSFIHADVVREGDIFAYDLGQIKTHIPWFLRRDRMKPKEEGEIYAIYAMATDKHGGTKAEVLSVADVESIRSRSPAKNNGPWVTDWIPMAKKSAFKQLSKWLVLSPEFRTAVQDDDDNVIETTAIRKEQLIPQRLSDIGQRQEAPPQESKEEPEQQDEEPASFIAEKVVSTVRETEETFNLPEGSLQEQQAYPPRETKKPPEKTVDDRPSNMDECLTWVRGQVGCSVDGKVDNGRVTVILPNQTELILTESPIRPMPIGPMVVEVRDVDALTQVQNTYAKNKKVK